MKKVLFTVFLLGLVASVSAATTPLLVEAYQEGTINIPVDETDTVTIAEVSFFVDSACYVQSATGGLARRAEIWLELDGERLPPIIQIQEGEEEGLTTIIYTYLLDPGEHIISLLLRNFNNFVGATICHDSYLQALIFLPDAGGAVAERPAGDTEPTDKMTSVISRGPYVTVTGATELVDATGRVIENAIEEDRVSINNLSQGTYFARDGERTVVKIVKVE